MCKFIQNHERKKPEKKEREKKRKKSQRIAKYKEWT